MPFVDGNGILPSWDPPLSNVTLEAAVYFFVQISVLWGLINLLPVYPLDGGQACYQILLLFQAPDALAVSFKISLVAAGAVVIYALTRQPRDIYLALLFGCLAYQNLSMLQQTGRGGGYGRW